MSTRMTAVRVHHGILFLLCLFIPVEAKTPDAELYVNNTLYLASYGDFGSQATFVGLSIEATPQSDPLLCGNETVAMSGNSALITENSLILVPRGECSFQYKLQRAVLWGGKGVIVYNTLQSRYDYNESVSAVVYPQPQRDYECSFGNSFINSELFELDPPAYNGSKLDQYLVADSPSNLCELPTTCESQRCLITSKLSNDSYSACCAWDIHVGMSQDASLADTSTDYDKVAIFVTMAQASELLLLIGTQAIIRPRPTPVMNVSSLLLWLLAVCIVTFACWNSASEYRRARYKLSNPPTAQQEPQRDQSHPQEVEMVPTVVSLPENSHDRTSETLPLPEGAPPTLDDSNADQGPERSLSQQRTDEHVASHESSEIDTEQQVPSESDTQLPDLVAPEVSAQAFASNSPQPVGNARREQRQPQHPAALQLTMWHAALFVIVASVMLLLLFFFEFYTAITVLYGVGCSGAMSQVIFRPLFGRIAVWFGVLSRIESALCPKVLLCGLDKISCLDAIAGLVAFAIGSSWLFVWFTATDPSQNAFYWITQNVMGACICILCLNILRLNSIKVATVLLIAVFIYDIFFVFLSPYIFNGESVMITVASGGGGTEPSADFCEKYPSDSQCRNGQPIPMLLTIPRINDYRGGSAMLGLGDIVLPGLLISFATRLDEAKYLVGAHTRMNIRRPPSGGFLFYLAIAYACGLLMATIAVVLMDRGQPALLYLVPTVFGTFLILGRHELDELWEGPRVLVWADRLVRYSATHTFVRAHDDATEAESLDDLDMEHGDVAAGETPENQVSPEVGERRFERDQSSRELI